MRPSRALIDLAALRRNFQRAAALAPRSRNVAVVKANGYGHGMTAVARALEGVADALAVATIDEALALRADGITAPVLVLQGAASRGDVEEAAAHGLWLMLNRMDHVDAACALRGAHGIGAWVKVDTGMRRLGITPGEAARACAALAAATNVSGPVVLSTHLACADDVDSPVTARQLAGFAACGAGLGLPRSIANSAGILHWPAAHADWNRPGIMLYGCEPTGAFDGGASGLEATMRVTSELIAIRDVKAGEGVGYGHRWTASRPTRIGTVSVGYADGYPRHAANGTPVLVGGRRAALVGTVSMDMLTVDLDGLDEAQVGDPVELWGPNLPVNEVAAHAGTIGYDLLAGMTARLPRVYVDAEA